MAPTKPMGTDSNPKIKPGVTGFVQEYNQNPGVRQDLNPDAVTENSVLPEPMTPKAVAPMALNPRSAAVSRGALKGTRKARVSRKAAK